MYGRRRLHIWLFFGIFLWIYATMKVILVSLRLIWIFLQLVLVLGKAAYQRVTMEGANVH